MRYWWVNQNQTYKHEVPGGYLWSPKTRKDGVRNYFYDTMTQAKPGDVVLSFDDTWLKAVGIVQAPAVSAPKPTEFGAAGAAWGEEGWFLEVEFTELQNKIRPRDHMERLRPLLPEKYSPLQQEGDGNQGVYLTELPFELAKELGFLIGAEFLKTLTVARVAPKESADDAAESAVLSRPDLAQTHKIQLVKARRGQGLFKSRVELLEPSCRVTGVQDRQHLRASHIMPWRVSDDRQKLDGSNGLLLSPHVDHLFDQGYITFKNDGTLVPSERVSKDVLQAWGIDRARQVKAFTAEQAVYLDYHRQHIFRRAE